MRILVTYFSETGNTKKVAESIGGAAKVEGNNVVVASIGGIDVSELSGFDVVFLGSTCHSSDIAAPVRDFLDRIPTGTTLKLAGFVTHSTMMPEGAAWKREMYERWAGKCLGTFEHLCASKGFGFLGFFHCQGAPSPEIETFIRSSIIPDEAQWNEYIDEARLHPTPTDLELAREFAGEMLAKR